MSVAPPKTQTVNDELATLRAGNERLLIERDEWFARGKVKHDELTKLRAENERLRAALELAANRLDRLVLECEMGTPIRYAAAEWTADARAVLAENEKAPANPAP